MTPKTTLMGVPKAVVDRGRYFVMALEYGGAPSLPRGLPSPPPGVIVYTVFITAKQWQPVAAALAADPTDQMIVEGFVYYDEALETLALLAQSATTLKTQKKTLTAKEAAVTMGETPKPPAGSGDLGPARAGACARCCGAGGGSAIAFRGGTRSSALGVTRRHPCVT